MKIWIDGYEANVPQRLGSSRVAFELINNLEKLDTENDYTILLPNPPLNDLPKEREGWKYKILKPKRLWTRIALPLALFTSKQKPDIIFSPTQYIPRFCPKSIKRITTIFDLAPLRFPDLYKKEDLYKLKNWTKYSVEHANHVITISQFSKKEVMKNYNIKKGKVTVAYPGFNSSMKKVNEKGETVKVLQKYNIDKDYIIFIGTIQPRKNLIRLIEAFVKIENLKLVIVGKTSGLGRQGWMYEDILEKPEELGIKDKVIFTGFVPDEDMLYLLNEAEAFILPSLWEGFGIPVVDAMACGVPVLVSNVSSLPEVVGNAGLTFDPTSVDQIEQAIRTIATDKKLRQKLSKLSLIQSKKFSWSKMAREVLRVFENI